MKKQCPACLCAHNEKTELCAADARLAQQLEYLRALAILTSLAVFALLYSVVVG